MKYFESKKKQRFSIRKLSVGVCSVLIGISSITNAYALTSESELAEPTPTNLSSESTSESESSEPEASNYESRSAGMTPGKEIADEENNIHMQGFVDESKTSTSLDNLNGASITRSQYPDSIQAEYQKDPRPNSITYLVLDLPGLRNPDEFRPANNTRVPRDIYVTFSKMPNNDNEILVRVVDKADNHRVLGTKTYTKGSYTDLSKVNGLPEYYAVNSNGTLDFTRPYSLNVSFATVSSAGLSNDQMLITNDPHKGVGRFSPVYQLLSGGLAVGEKRDTNEFIVPSTSTQTAYYKEITKDDYDAWKASGATEYKPTGNETYIAKYLITGVLGDAYTSSDKRALAGYEYVWGKKVDGKLSPTYQVGGVYERVINPLNQYSIRLKNTVETEDGDVRITLEEYVVNGRRVLDSVPGGEWRNIYTSRELIGFDKPADDGNYRNGTGYIFYVGRSASVISLHNRLTRPFGGNSYYYYIKQGNVVVKYEEENTGRSLKDGFTLIENVNSGTPYNATPENIKLATIKTADKKVYELSPSELKTGSAAATGVVEAGLEKVVTFIYNEVFGNVNVAFVDEKANTIRPTENLITNGSNGVEYDASSKKRDSIVFEGRTYKFKEVRANQADATESGEVEAKKTKTVTYVYAEVLQNAVVEYFDETDNKLLDTSSQIVGRTKTNIPQSGAVSGKGSNVAETIAYYEARGYEVKSNGFDSSPQFDNDENTTQKVRITLVHKTQTIPPTDPKTPGTPIHNVPNSPTYPQETARDQLNKEVSREIKYWIDNVGGAKAFESVVQKVSFSRSATIDMVSGRLISQSDWSPSSSDLPAVNSPSKEHYTVDRQLVPVQSVPSNTENGHKYIEDVIYRRNPQKALVKYIDKTDSNRELATSELTEGNPNSEISQNVATSGKGDSVAQTIAYYEARGYEVQTNEFDQNPTFDDVDGNTQEIKVYLVHKIITVPPTDPKPVGTPINNVPNSPNYPAQVSQQGLNKTVTRKINYWVDVVGGEVAFPSVTQSIGFERSARVDAVTGELKSLTAWTPKQPLTSNELEAVTSPQKQYYRADKPNVDVQTVPIDTADGYEYVVDVVYKPIEQVGKVQFTVKGENQPKFEQALKGKTNDAFGYDPAEKIREYENLGYKVVNKDNYDKDSTFDDIEGNSQDFKFELIERVSPITPDSPGRPGEPIDPNYPDGPKWPDGTDEAAVKRVITRSVSYEKQSKEGVVEGEAAPSQTNTVEYRRVGEINHVSGEVSFKPWSAVEDDRVLDGNPLPLIKGYLAVSATKISGDGAEEGVNPNTTSLDVNTDENSKNIVEKVVYKPLGSWVVNIPKKDEPNKIVYPNDPKGRGDTPGSPTDPDVEKIPYVPGYIPLGPDGRPLVPVDEKDITKGYIPPTPQDPIEDTVISYEKSQQVGKVKFIVKGEDQPKFEENLEGKTEEPFGYDPSEKIREYENLGYEVRNKDNYSKDDTFDNIDGNSQDFTFELIEKKSPITPDAPGRPGEPIDPNYPDGPKWPEGTDEAAVKRVITRSVSYEKQSKTGVVEGEAAPSQSNSVEFRREGEINHVSGKVSFKPWSAVEDDSVLDGNPLPLVKGYLAVSATKVRGDESEEGVDPNTTSLNVNADENSKNIVEKVVYKPLGSWVLELPPGEDPRDDIKYPNNPKDPKKVGEPGVEYEPNTPPDIIPYVPGYFPVDPDGKPLVPVDEKDITKGYIPPAPKDPLADTLVSYERSNQVGKVKFTVNGENQPKFEEDLNGKTGDAFGYDPAEKIREYENLGYEVRNKDNYSKDDTFDNIDGNSQDFTFELIEKVSPITPDAPGRPGEPIDPNYPDGPKWPEGTDEFAVKRVITRSVSYEKQSKTGVVEGEAAPSQSNSVEFRREGEINHVSGKVSFKPWSAVEDDSVLEGNTLPLVKGYLAVSATKTIGDEAEEGVNPTTTILDINTDENSKDIVEKVVYKPLGSWVVKIPKKDDPDKIGYPNNPNGRGDTPGSPTDPDVQKIPYVPGYTPVGPDGKPLVPVDPKDITKGYLPPTPQDPGEDMVIEYLPNPPVPKKSSSYERGNTPNTGDESSEALGIMGLMSALLGIGVFSRRKKEDD